MKIIGKIVVGSQVKFTSTGHLGTAIGTVTAVFGGYPHLRYQIETIGGSSLHLGSDGYGEIRLATDGELILARLRE